ncbi:MAG: endonuclease [Phycisphaerae bacterium]|nr:endonuclease [Phycisphaerae bacterium]
MNSLVTVPAVLVFTAAALAQYDPPPGYYSTATGTGATLRAQLRAIIGRNYWVPGSVSHQVRSYDNARLALPILSRDPNDPSRVINIYSGVSTPAVWDAGITWNREHTWPDSRGLGGNGPDYTDLHQLRPCNPSVNSSRNNDPFGVGGGAYWDPQPSTNSYFNGVGNGVYVPGTNDRGEMARAMMYMDVRYDGTDPQTTDLVLVNGFPSGNQMGDLAQLLAWHYEDPVNNTERERNFLVFDNVANPLYYQGNRNPFVDRPEFVWAIFGTSPNNSTLYVGGAPAPDGSSSASVIFRVIQGFPASSQIITLNKSGTTPTTFNATFTGPFSVAGAGAGRAFPYNPGSTNFTIAPLSTATIGNFFGILTIDNTDLTSAAPGSGSADADDLVTLYSDVLTPSNPSLNSGTDVNLGTVSSTFAPNTGTHTIAVAVHNLAFSTTTALMDIDSIAGGATPFSVVSGATTGVGAAPALVTFAFDTNAASPGLHSATFIIDTSDEDIPGETQDAVAVIWDVTIAAPPACEGDANGDLLIDFADITTVLANWGHGAGPGDVNTSGQVDFGDITTVLAHWGDHCR